MHKSEYIEYLKSEDWKERRQELMEQAGWVCSECGEKATQLHHVNYNNIGMEELEDDVIAICNDCHNKIHEKGEYGYEDYKGWC